MTTEQTADAAVLLGAAAVAVGLALIWLPLALIVLGTASVAGGIFFAPRRKGASS